MRSSHRASRPSPISDGTATMFNLEHALQPGYSFGNSLELGLDLIVTGIREASQREIRSWNYAVGPNAASYLGATTLQSAAAMTGFNASTTSRVEARWLTAQESLSTRSVASP